MQQTLTEFGFEAAHQTPGHCGLHGHSFRVKGTLSGEAHPVFSWSHGLDEVEPVIDVVRRELDHRHLNKIEGFSVPALENVARWIWQRLSTRLQGLDRVVARQGQPGSSQACACSGEH